MKTKNFKGGRIYFTIENSMVNRALLLNNTYKMYIECLRDCRLVQNAILDLSWLYKNVTENRMGNQETKQKQKKTKKISNSKMLDITICKHIQKHK